MDTEDVSRRPLAQNKCNESRIEKKIMKNSKINKANEITGSGEANEVV